MPNRIVITFVTAGSGGVVRHCLCCKNYAADPGVVAPFTRSGVGLPYSQHPVLHPAVTLTCVVALIPSLAFLQPLEPLVNSFKFLKGFRIINFLEIGNQIIKKIIIVRLKYAPKV